MAAFEWSSIRHEGVEVFRRCALDDGSILTVRERAGQYAWAHRGPSHGLNGRLVVHATGEAATAEQAERQAEDYVLVVREAERCLNEIRQFTVAEVGEMFGLTPEEISEVEAENEWAETRRLVLSQQDDLALLEMVAEAARLHETEDGG